MCPGSMPIMCSRPTMCSLTPRVLSSSLCATICSTPTTWRGACVRCHTCTCMHGACTLTIWQGACVRYHTCTCARMRMCIVCMCACVHVCMSACVHVCMYAPWCHAASCSRWTASRVGPSPFIHIQVANSFTLRIVLLLVDSDNAEGPVLDVTRAAMLHDCMHACMHACIHKIYTYMHTCVASPARRYYTTVPFG